jgi:tetratricopeptide (TPR) repeat protein
MALGLCLYWEEKKYDAALKEFERAAAASPDNAEIYTYVGGIYRRQGRWREAVASFARALSLDPRNAHIVFRSAINHIFIRDWPAAAPGYKRALEITPDNLDAEVGLAYLEVVQNGNPAAGSKILQNIPAGREGDVASARWDLAMLERDYATAEKIVTESPLEDFPKAGDAPKVLPGTHRPRSRRHRIGPALFCRGGANFRKAAARRSRRCRTSRRTRLTLCLHAKEGGGRSRSWSRG